MKKRLEWQGGSQEGRMIRDKYKTFLKALKYSYQSCDISPVQKFDSVLAYNQLENNIRGTSFRALINPDKVKQDYDDKILSVDYRNGFDPGDIFKWVGTDTYWIITLQELTEDAYFRSEIRRCKYQIRFKDQNGNWCCTWAAIRGPVETVIESIQKNQVRIDRPNLGLNILLPKNEQTLFAFDRYSEFLFEGKCWRVQAPDSISIKNIIEVNAEEYYIDKSTDDIENEMKNGLQIAPIDPIPDSCISGPTFIKPKITETYSVEEFGGKWSILEDFPVCIKQRNSKTIDLTWQKATSGQFTLQWTKGDMVCKKIIVVESLF